MGQPLAPEYIKQLEDYKLQLDNYKKQLEEYNKEVANVMTNQTITQNPPNQEINTQENQDQTTS